MCAFCLMNSFSTSEDTRAHLARYPELGDPGDPRGSSRTRCQRLLSTRWPPLEWPADPDLEWCPPGHGDLYPAILGSGMLDRLIKEGYLYLFVSNSDNLVATMDPALLNWFASSDMPFLMEVTTRTGADRKGGHLAKRAKRWPAPPARICPVFRTRIWALFRTSIATATSIRTIFGCGSIAWPRRLTAMAVCLPLPVIRNQEDGGPAQQEIPSGLSTRDCHGRRD